MNEKLLKSIDEKIKKADITAKQITGLKYEKMSKEAIFAELRVTTPYRQLSPDKGPDFDKGYTTENWERMFRESGEFQSVVSKAYNIIGNKQLAVLNYKALLPTNFLVEREENTSPGGVIQINTKFGGDPEGILILFVDGHPLGAYISKERPYELLEDGGGLVTNFNKDEFLRHLVRSWDSVCNYGYEEIADIVSKKCEQLSAEKAELIKDINSLDEDIHLAEGRIQKLMETTFPESEREER